MNMWLLVFVTVIFLICTDCTRRNVCPTYLDYFTINTNEKCWYDVAADSDAPTIIRSHGFPLEIHRVLTPDQYILTMFRIPNAHGRKEPIFLQHGFFLSGACFVGLGNLSLGLTLANEGYDVWIGNFRGTSYSNKHAILKSEDIQYWNFNSDHLGLHDVPTMLKYIARKTGQAGRIIYIGHSLGTTTFLEYGSRFPDQVKNLVKLAILMAPNGGMRNTKAFFFRIGVLFTDMIRLVTHTEMTKLFTPRGILQVITKLCRASPTLMEYCIRVINLTTLGPQKETDASVAPIVFNQFPEASSLKVYQQIAAETVDDFRSYDYGSRNFFVYGQLLPPIYNVSKIEVPIYLIYSKRDWCTTSKDAEILFGRLHPRAKIYGRYELSDFNHNDFLYSKHAKSVVYDKILNLIDSARTLELIGSDVNEK
ncbi:hypothetical protein PPYR_07343 [Photinus pyralis]|uniref:Lipase n=1 Tax=Photinus pyralis TaxID=7054 RepID=A0A5N4AQC0_PHOPY|nr:lipase 3-like isoform X1 [Photinus pyralis]KAB0799463.1 hypothetical protein PPYR_07343 [Photinus pyralis]